jgi:hypothetical protein
MVATPGGDSPSTAVADSLESVEQVYVDTFDEATDEVTGDPTPPAGNESRSRYRRGPWRRHPRFSRYGSYHYN